jgi:hypothetical protein
MRKITGDMSSSFFKKKCEIHARLLFLKIEVKKICCSDTRTRCAISRTQNVGIGVKAS